MSERAKQISVILISWLLTVGFLIAGGSKLAGAEFQVEDFQSWGYPLWFMYLTGALEVLAALLIFVPPTRLIGALLLIVIMIGATATHLWFAEWDRVIWPIIPLVLAAYVAYMRRPGWRGKRSLRKPIA